MISKGLVYYTDNYGDKNILDVCRRQIQKCADIYNLPIVSVSQKPINFGRNIVMNITRSNESMFKQILKGVEEVYTEIIFLLEHDLLYHPAHFDFMPEDENTFYYDHNRWAVCADTGKATFYYTNCPSLLCARRSLLVDHYSKCVESIKDHGFKKKYGYSPPKGLPKSERAGKAESYFASGVSVDIRRSDAWTRRRMDRSQFRSEGSCKGWTESDSVPGWGKTKGRFNEFLNEAIQ